MHGERLSIISEVAVSELPPWVVNCSDDESNRRLGIRDCLQRNNAASAGEILVQDIPVSALTGKVLILNVSTPIGKKIMNIIPGDREYDERGGVKSFGRFGRWFVMFEKMFPTEEEKGELMRLLTVTNSSSGRRITPTVQHDA
jgi:hypothetical protein